MERSPFEMRCRRAMRQALWFGAVFTIACAVATLALASGLVGREQDASIAGLLTFLGALLFAANLAAKRFFLS